MKLSFLFLFLIIVRFAYSQDMNKQQYFVNLQKQLLKDTSLSDVKYIEKKYHGGQLKYQFIAIKIKKDKYDRYWMVGKSYRYHKNGNLSSYMNIDFRTKTLRDTSFVYDKKTQLINLTIFNNKSKYSDVAYPIFKRFFNYFFCYPDSLSETIYKNGIKKYERIAKYNPNKNIYDNIVENKYNKKGELTKSFKQEDQSNVNQIKKE
jgi:hypothetical protein